jgi:uncharacterized protein YciI
MKYFVVTQECGPAWNPLRSMKEQEEWTEHATFVEKLADEGFIVLGGPLGDESRILLVFNAQGEDAVKTRLAADPWMQKGIRKITKIEPWHILLGNTS